MEQIIILPKDVTVTFLMDINEIEITINKENVLVNGELSMDAIFEELGNCDVIECNEINPTTDTWVCTESKIYIITPNNLKELKDNGSTQLGYHGLIKDNVDLNADSDVEFIKWYYNADTVDEAVEFMNKTIADIN